MSESIHPRIGVASILVDLNNNKILFGQRKNSHGEGSWCVPGGHLEFNETPIVCARRELLEETGLAVGKIIPHGYTNDFFKEEEKHYITLHMFCEYVGGDALVKEPHKMAAWKWCTLDSLPKPLFIPIGKITESIPDFEYIKSIFAGSENTITALMTR